MRPSARSKSRSVTAMDRSPFDAQAHERPLRRSLDPVHLMQAEPVVLAELWRPAWAIQKEHRFAVRSSDVNMRRAMIVWINDHAQAIEPMNGRHRLNVSE